jgi:hypothetical protein
MRRAALLLAATSLGLVLGCGSGVVDLSREELDRLPRDSRQEIFDAENDVVIARNRQDETDDKKRATEQAIADLEARWERIEKRLSSGGQSGKIAPARKVFEANKAYLGALMNAIDAAVETTRLEAALSRARLDLVRQRQAARIGRATLGSLTPLERKVAEAEAKVKAASAAQIDLRAQAQSRLDAWKGAEDEYARSSSDYDTGVWE